MLSDSAKTAASFLGKQPPQILKTNHCQIEGRMGPWHRGTETEVDKKDPERLQLQGFDSTELRRRRTEEVIAQYVVVLDPREYSTYPDVR